MIRGEEQNEVHVAGRQALIERREAQTLGQARDDFMSRKGRFAGEWVPMGAGNRYVRYDQILQVEGKLD